MSFVSSLKKRLEVESAGFRYWKPTFACLPTPANWRAWPLKNPWSALRVGGSSVLKSSSRSTAVVGLVGADVAAVVDRLAVRLRLGREASGRCSGSRCPTARTGGSSRACRRAAASGRRRPRTRSPPGRSSVMSMSLTEPIGTPPVWTGLPVHELAGVQEVGGDGVARTAAAEEEDRDENDSSDDRRQGGNAPDPAYRSHPLLLRPPRRRPLVGPSPRRAAKSIPVERRQAAVADARSLSEC